MKKHLVNLVPTERADVERFVRTDRRGAGQHPRACCRWPINRASSEGDAEIARTLGVNLHTVENIRRRYAQHAQFSGLDQQPARFSR